MIISLATESTIITDADAPEIAEQPIVVENYEGSEGVSLQGFDGERVYVPYRMVKEVTKVMLQSTPGDIIYIRQNNNHDNF